MGETNVELFKNAEVTAGVQYAAPWGVAMNCAKPEASVDVQSLPPGFLF
jgi:hypothetical protein